VDYVTGTEISFAIFYLAPVSAVTWLAGRRLGLLASVLAGATWLVAELAWHVAYSYPAVPYWNASVRLGFFVIVTLLVDTLRNFNEGLESTVATRTKDLAAEVEASAALARVAHQIIVGLDAPRELVPRLCQAIAEVLRSDTCHTLMLEPTEHVFRWIAGYGAPPEEETHLRTVTIPSAALAGVLSRLDADEVVPGDALPPDWAHALVPAGGVELCLALRRGTELVGMQILGCSGRPTALTAQRLRVARGIAQLASMGLEHARVVGVLAQADRLKADFIATISHELRTPLNIIMGYLTLMLEDAFGSLTGEQSEVLGRVQRSATELLELINATLDVARLDAGLLPLDLKTVALPALLDDIANEIPPFEPQAPVHLEWQVAPALPPCTPTRSSSKS